jgi:16S rRNA (cytidine1402-2'-O)-methyltransferase
LKKGKLYLLSNLTKNLIDNSNHFIVENEKQARRFIKKINPEKNQEKIEFFILNKHTDNDLKSQFLKPCQ